uniref:Putative mrna export factor tap/mex67 n=1 Tax=Nyssomyia neivai TaxID=330878 RepID=A0A1L8DH92_9DIPT
MQKFSRGGRGGGGGRFNGNKDRFQKRDATQDDEGVGFNYHDGNRRRRSGDDKRRVSFKTTDRQGRQRFSDGAIRKILEEDEDMSGNEPNRNNRFQQNSMRRRGSPIPRRGGFGGQKNRPIGRRSLPQGTAGWYKVIVKEGAKYSKEVLYKQILDHIFPQIFVPHYFAINGEGCSFYLDEYATADKLFSNNRIEMPNGKTLFLSVFSNAPNAHVDNALTERIKLAMGKRYNSQTKTLDLSRFHADSDLTDIFVLLSRVSIMGAAIGVITENIPEIETLMLSDNKIYSLTHFDTLAKKCINLKNLCLRNNKISMTNTLDHLINLPLTELVLTGNPIKDKLPLQQYISEVRQRAPRLVILDGEPLPPQIGFDVTPEGVLPISRPSFLCDINGQPIVRQFLDQYFMLYDSENRQPLLDAYHEHATFTLTSYSPFEQQPERGLRPYSFTNRNLLNLKGNNSSRNRRFIKYGRLQVVSQLSEFPPTQHDPQSFAVDLAVFLPQMILLTITGIFREKRKNQTQPLRSFQKCLLIVPHGQGFCIRNEMLHVTDVTRDQTMGAFKPMPNEQPQMQAAPVAPVAPIQAMPSTSHGIDDVTKMQMVQALAQKTNMNMDWSRKCLEEVNWDFEKAGAVFLELHKRNQIPAEAFIK